MPRVTLYVTDELKARMDEVGEAVNWSAIAQRAFREAVAINNLARKDRHDMREVIERLRASKERIEARAFEEGKDEGKNWATNSAEYDELERVAEYHDGSGEGDLDILHTILDPEGEREGHEWADFWAPHAPTDAFARGFIEGAAEIYHEVAGKL